MRERVIHASALNGKVGTLCRISSNRQTSSTYANCKKCSIILKKHGGIRNSIKNGGGWFYPYGWKE